MSPRRPSLRPRRGSLPAPRLARLSAPTGTASALRPQAGTVPSDAMGVSVPSGGGSAPAQVPRPGGHGPAPCWQQGTRPCDLRTWPVTLGTAVRLVSTSPGAGVGAAHRDGEAEHTASCRPPRLGCPSSAAAQGLCLHVWWAGPRQGQRGRRRSRHPMWVPTGPLITPVRC